MENIEFYDLSAQLGRVVNGAKHLMGTGAFRYHYLVNNSDLGLECTYAKIVSKNFHDPKAAELEELRGLLISLRDQCDRALTQLPGELTPPTWLRNLLAEQEMNGG